MTGRVARSGHDMGAELPSKRYEVERDARSASDMAASRAEGRSVVASDWLYLSPCA